MSLHTLTGIVAICFVSRLWVLKQSDNTDTIVMKQKILMIAAATAAAFFTSNSRADLYPDTVGDEFTGNPHLDITSVEVTNNFSDVIFKIKLNGNPVAVDWGKYCIGFSTGPNGDTSANGNGWGRPISLTQGMNYWVGSWVDGVMGAQLFNYTGAAWAGPTGASISKTTNSVTINVPMAGLGKTFGDTISFDVYTTGGGGGDPAIDSLANPAQTVSSWSTPYATNLVRNYTLQIVGATTNHVSFLCNMEVPISKYDANPSSTESFNTNSDTLFVRGSFNGWGTTSTGYQLFQVGASAVFSNTVEVIATYGDTVAYKFQGTPFPGYENPVLTAGGNRQLTITNVNQKAPYAFFGDLALSNGISTVTFLVDMNLQAQMGLFDAGLNTVTLPGNFNSWNNSAITLTEVNLGSLIYSTTLTYTNYPLSAQNVGFYKFFIANSTVARDGGWENPISTSSGNRAFAISSHALTNLYYYNDENPNFKATAVQKLDADSTKITWQSFPNRNNIPTGGVYQVESRNSLNSGSWISNGTVISTASSSSFTNTGLTGTNRQFYRISLKALVP